MLDLLAKGTDRGYSMIGVGLSAGLSGSRRARTVQDPLPALDLGWATNRSLPASYGPTPTFTRASTGTYFDGQGILKSAAVNGPRFNHVYNGTSWVSRGLLVEEQRTNINLYSEQFDNASYSASQVTISANQINSPDGATTADRLTGSAGTVLPNVFQNTTTASGSVYTFSVFVKKDTHDFLQFVLSGVADGYANFNLSSGVVGTLGSGGSATSAIVNVGNGWYRCSVTYTTSSTSGSVYICLVGSATAGRAATFSAAGTESVYLWGAQLELGAFATSYIPTTSASVTRSADVCQITGSDFSGFWNGTEGSVAVEFDRLATVGLSGYTSPRVLTFRTDDNNNIQAYCATPGGPYGEYAPVIYNGGAFQGMPDSIGSAIAANTSAKIAFCYKANDFAGTLNGAAVVTDNSGTIPAINQLHIGAYSSANLMLNGHIARLRYYQTRLTNAKLQELST